MQQLLLRRMLRGPVLRQRQRLQWQRFKLVLTLHV
jgi:hypothetical protein